MRSSSKRVLGLLLLTVSYWLFALAFLGLALLPECLTDVRACEASKRSFAALVLGVEVALYALLLFAVSRARSSTRWIILFVLVAIIAAVYLRELGLY
jgi:multisubunit Na+/H+ antiporter MnhG subunit